jgi:pyrimidine operon attenuation protein/uracil phosphoribosyltransferase
MPEKIIMSHQDIQQALAQIAAEIVEKNEGSQNLILIGLRTRGVPLAQRIATLIRESEKTDVPIGAIDITLYRDDLEFLGIKPKIQQSDIPTNIIGKNVVLVDDVLFTGRSARAAMDALVDFGRPACIQLAVLVDRGHRETPIKATYIGKKIPSARHEDIQVRLEEIDGREKVVVIEENGD